MGAKEMETGKYNRGRYKKMGVEFLYSFRHGFTSGASADGGEDREAHFF